MSCARQVAGFDGSYVALHLEKLVEELLFPLWVASHLIQQLLADCFNLLTARCAVMHWLIGNALQLVKALQARASTQVALDGFEAAWLVLQPPHWLELSEVLYALTCVARDRVKPKSKFRSTS